jgi:cardiolipin synthase
MLDSAGSVAFFRSPWAGMLRNSGIEVVESLKVNLMRVFLRRMDLRQHRKMILIDNYIAYTGSMNMVDPRFFKQDAGVGQWVDLMARMEGPVSTAMGIVYSCDWEIETGKRILPPPPDANIMPFEQASGHTIHTIASGPGFPEDLIHQALLTAVYASREYLIMTTPISSPAMTFCMPFVPPRNEALTSALSCRVRMTRCWLAGPAGPFSPNCWLRG